MRSRPEQLNTVRPDSNHIIRKQVVDHVVSELVIRAIAVMFIALIHSTRSFGALNVQPQLLPCITANVPVTADAPGSRHTLQRLTNHIAVVLRRGHKRGEPAAIVAVVKTVELTIFIVRRDVGNQLGVKHLNVIGLVKVIGDDLPVAPRLGGHIEHPEHVFDAVRFQFTADGLA